MVSGSVNPAEVKVLYRYTAAAAVVPDLATALTALFTLTHDQRHRKFLWQKEGGTRVVESHFGVQTYHHVCVQLVVLCLVLFMQPDGRGLDFYG